MNVSPKQLTSALQGLLLAQKADKSFDANKAFKNMGLTMTKKSYEGLSASALVSIQGVFNEAKLNITDFVVEGIGLGRGNYEEISAEMCKTVEGKEACELDKQIIALQTKRDALAAKVPGFTKNGKFDSVYYVRGK